MFFDDFKIKHKIELEPVKINKEDMVSFAKKYDNIPLHTDEEYAKTTHFGAIIAPGVMSFMAVWSKYLEIDLFGEELIAGKSAKIEWFKPVYADDVLKGTVTVSDLTKRNEKNGIVQLTIEVFNQHGELVLTNVTEAVVKCRKNDC